jgi:hypothetical protein
MIDFSPVDSGEQHMIEFVEGLTRDDLRAYTNESIDHLMMLLDGLTDGDVTFIPEDPDADDPFAEQEEHKHIGWSLAHLVAHVTASSEEGAALSSLLARGFATAERPRYETPWESILTREHCLQRLQESRRMRLAYLDTWPDKPFLNVYREVSPRFTAKLGLMNAPAAFMFGLRHEVGHYEQFRDVRQQALAKRQMA